MKLVALPAFTDNYIWMLHDGLAAIVVDPGDAATVLQTLEAQGLRLAGILVTHHHHDHTGGIDALRQRFECPVFGPAAENIPRPYHPCRDGDTIELLGLAFEVMEVPGHTAGHLAYFLPSPQEGQDPTLFCGDTLFSGGCGRLFEGSAEQMLGSLSRLAALPDGTLICCAHEYTLSNLRFAREIEPLNQALTDYAQWCQSQRDALLPTLPARLARERDINPFLRCAQPDVIAAALAHGAVDSRPVSVFAALRQWKNNYR